MCIALAQTRGVLSQVVPSVVNILHDAIVYVIHTAWAMVYPILLQCMFVRFCIYNLFV